MNQISWDNDESHLLINPSYSEAEKKQFQQILKTAQNLSGHIWLSTSGSSVQKWVGLSKSALLASAQAVNEHLKSNREDRWINALPFFHVGSLGIWARAHLSGAQVCDYKQEYPGKWNAEAFYTYLEQKRGTLSALVPAQLHDFVMLGKTAPSSLRALIIGGGMLLPSLYEKAIALKWPVLPSYGLTECASQVATSVLGSWEKGEIPALQLLPHFHAGEHEGRLCFAGPSLLTAYAYLHESSIQIIDPKIEGWLMTEDRGTISENQLKVDGRMDALVKIGGENVDMAALENLLQALRLQLGIKWEATLVAMPDNRLGHCIHLASTSAFQEEIKSLMQHFHASVLPFERIREVFFIPELPRSPMGKILKNQLKEQILVKRLIS